MGIGGAELKVAYTSTSLSGSAPMGEVQHRHLQKSPIRTDIAPLEEVTAHINPSACINCGTCREICPVSAISEHQRVICHGCPVCTEKPGISPQEMDALAVSTSCTTACPLGISPQGYIGLTKDGKVEEAFNLIWDKNPLPSVCGSVCHHPCEDACKRGLLVDEPIKIRAVKKYLANEVDAPVKKYNLLHDDRIAVIGAGPAGLTAAHYLSSAGYEVTVFESAPEAGGMLKRGIPAFRLDRRVVERDVRKLEEAGLDIRLDARIDRYALEKIRREYDVVIVATGTPNSKELKIPGQRLAGVMNAMNFMAQVNNDVAIRRHLGQIFEFKGGEAVVIGGGSVAMDVARAAMRVGAKKVTVVCLEQGEAVPAHDWEITEAKAEGITIMEGYSPIAYQSSLFPELQGVKLARVKNFKKDEAGKISFDIDRADTLSIKADWVVEAIGQAPDALWSTLSGDDVFFAGDIKSNACSVVDAMASGRKTAIEVDTALRGRKVKDAMETHELSLADVMEKIFPYNRRKTVRPETPLLDAQTRAHSFDEVEGVLKDAQVRQEVASCLGCGYEVVNTKECIACGMCQKLCPKGNVITMVAKEGGNGQ
ncbi:FAD-dependent oxidoreductase [Christensenellaceae bacterium OttesenSCG-928-M15]|nr:FAD-dependent oxidoreductase [Christensenellaceae bacterium OttesenSCG-928-M15]